MAGNGVFITGTDTGVGKTVVSAILIRTLIKSGIRTGAMKPIETGCSERAGTLIPADGTFLYGLAGMDDRLDLVTPVRYRNPVAPIVAETLESRTVDLQKVFDAYGTLRKKYDFMVVEGAGGLLVPTTKFNSEDGAVPYFVSDLIKDLGLPVILVSRTSLGTINHTLLSVEHALSKGLEVCCVVLNNHTPPEDTISEKTNPEVLRELCPVPVIGPIPYMEPITPESIESLATAYGKPLMEHVL